jgi:hypothetical protein
MMAVAWDEARALIEASSLNLVRATYATRTLELERGAIIRFFTVEDSLDVYKLVGNHFTQIMMLSDGVVPYPAGASRMLETLLKSNIVPPEQLLFQEYVTL